MRVTVIAAGFEHEQSRPSSFTSAPTVSVPPVRPPLDDGASHDEGTDEMEIPGFVRG
jgi:hypothetical protein